MQGKTTIIKTNGDIVVTQHDKPIPLDFLTNAVGGYIETVPYFNQYEGEACVVFCNEEGKLKGLPINVEANKLWHAQVKISDVLVGDIIIISGDDEFMDEL